MNFCPVPSVLWAGAMGCGAIAEGFGSRNKVQITVVTMSVFACVGFWVQTKLVQRMVPAENAEIHRRVQELLQQDLERIAAKGQTVAGTKADV